MQQEKTQVVLTSYSQPHVLQHRMKEERLTHGQTVTANLSPVRLEKANNGKMVMYFCPMQCINVTGQINGGDGGRLPETATLHNLAIPAHAPSGLYNLKNVKLHSNGTLQVIATEETVLECVNVDPSFAREPRDRDDFIDGHGRMCPLPF